MSTSSAPTATEVAIREAVATILRSIGEDPGREGLLKTPERVSKSWGTLAAGYQADPRGLLEGAIFHEECNEMVLVREIELYSLCEHHLLPFFGRCHVAYLPAGKIVGLSKIPRVVEAFSRRLQVQERLTSEIAHALADTLQPHGVGVVIEARHLCMMMRGVEKQNSLAVTSCMLGAFRDDPKTRSEFMELVGRKVSI
ncbi:MAG: GTP cyclohydrolase 1 [Gemmatimonadota bacterium]|nr:MAG: GTP cyclohydrolase 1 [Gemmatimonadota bacterium]